MSFVKRAADYADAVVGGGIPACLYVKQACQRFIDDLRREDLEFRCEKVEEWCTNFEKFPHVKGPLKGKLIKLEDWQVFNIANIFGWYKNGKRRFQDVYWEVPRKNTKSTMAAGIGIGLMTWDSEPTPEILAGATTEEQAWHVFGPAREMCKALPKIRSTYNIEVNAKSIVGLSDLSRFVPIIGNPGDGGSPTCGIVDEFHEHKTSDLVDTLETGMGTRLNPLLLHITTAGSDMGGPCYTKRADAISVLSGAVEDDRLYAIIYTIDENDEWDTVEAQIKANPNYGVSVNADFLEGQLKQARRSPSKQAAYKTKHLNQWVGAKAAWMNMLAYQACRKKALKIEDFAGRECFVGIDLASRDDVASMAILFPPVNGGNYAAFVKHYLPEDKILDVNRYQGFHAGGWLTSTPGNIIDFDYIKDDLKELKSAYQVTEVPYDPFQATKFVTEMLAEGFPMIEVGATVKNFSEPMKELEALIMSKAIQFEMDPVLMWMFGNVTAQIDKKDNIFPNKERPENKIDGVVALIMALNRALPHRKDQGSIYKEREMYVL